jgi:predicted DCC family thiol-disulfide oxidoreductase YuxK
VTPQSYAPIVFFDGVCNLCNHAVDFWISRLSGRLSNRSPLVLMQFASLQGETAKKMIGQQVDLGTPLSAAFSTVIFFKEGTCYDKSTAIIKICQEIGGIWGLASIGYLIPRVLRDLIYDGVAKSRYSIFGKRETCRLPTDSEKKYFLD